MDLVLILLVFLILLLVIQLIALLKVRYIIRRLKKMLNDISRIYNIPVSVSKNKHICRFCRYRQTFINAHGRDTRDNFYYHCRYHQKSIELNDSCRKFKPDPDEVTGR